MPLVDKGHYHILMAEGMGFEPMTPISRSNRLAGGRTSPLCDPSIVNISTSPLFLSRRRRTFSNVFLPTHPSLTSGAKPPHPLVVWERSSQFGAPAKSKISWSERRHPWVGGWKESALINTLEGGIRVRLAQGLTGWGKICWTFMKRLPLKGGKIAWC